jgi:hypothetical protein
MKGSLPTALRVATVGAALATVVSTPERHKIRITEPGR